MSLNLTEKCVREQDVFWKYVSLTTSLPKVKIKLSTEPTDDCYRPGYKMFPREKSVGAWPIPGSPGIFMSVQIVIFKNSQLPK